MPPLGRSQFFDKRKMIFPLNFRIEEAIPSRDSGKKKQLQIAADGFFIYDSSMLCQVFVSNLKWKIFLKTTFEDSDINKFL